MEDQEQSYLQKMKDGTRNDAVLTNEQDEKAHHSSPENVSQHTPPQNATYAYQQAAGKQSATRICMRDFRVKLQGWQIGRWLHQTPV